MKSMNKFRLFSGVAMLGLTFAMSSCVRKGFDTPPDDSYVDPQVPVTHTIAQMKAMLGAYTSTSIFPDTTFTGDIVISGVVTADDRSGNYYKQIVIQDSTGGVTININNYSLYAHYPVGRKLYIKLKGMTLSYDGGLPVLGLGLTEQRAVKGLESSDIDAHIIKGDIGHTVKDTVITLTQAKAADPFFYNRLVTVSDVEFLDTNKTYTESTLTTNRYLVNCAALSTAQQLVTRNSNYANFHGLNVPSGHGSLTGIFTVYQTSASNRTAQIVIRDTSDVKFYEPRCNGNVPPPTGVVLLEQFSGGTTGEIAITGWTNYAEAGGVKWKYGSGGTVSTKPYAQVTAYQTNQADVKSWLITSGVDLSGATTPKLTFISADGYDNGAVTTVMISTNYVPGTNPATATWTTLNPTISSGHTNSYGSFISSGDVSLSSYIGQTVYVAFKYVGSAPAKTTTFELDNVTITKQ